MSLQPLTTSFTTQPYLHFPSLKSKSDGRSSIHSLEKTHLSKNDVIRLVMDKDKPVFPVKAKFETGRPPGVPPALSSTFLKRKREQVDERGVEEEVARNVSKILSATRAAQNALPPPTLKTPLTNDPTWIKSISPSLKVLHCDTCAKNFPSPKSFRNHSCLPSTVSFSPSTLDLSQILPSTPIDLNGYIPNEIPSSLITPDLSSYESSPPSETASMEEWNGVSIDGKEEELREDLSSIPSKVASERKCCPDCGKALCSSGNLKRHRASCKGTADMKEEPSTPLPKWAENKSESWLQLSVGEHLRAQHQEMRNGGKEEKGNALSSPSFLPNPVAVKEEIEANNSNLMEKESKNGVDPRGPFECTVCCKTFSCRKNVRRHMVAIHKITPPPGMSLGLSLRTINNQSNRNTISRSSEDSLDCDEKQEEVKVEVKLEEIDEDSIDISPLGTEKNTVIVKKETRREKETPIGEKKTEREDPLDFTLPTGNKRLRLESLREEERAVISVHSVRFTVSRVGAMKASPYLASLLSNTREIALDVLPSALHNLLLVYSDNSKLTVDNISMVSEVAQRLKVNQVKNLCEKFITTELPKLSLIRAIRLADLYNLAKFKDELFDSLTIDVLRTISLHEDYREMRPELRAELLEKFGEFL